MTPLLSAQKTLPLSFPGVFHTVQGEGFLSGLPMVFVRLGGCSVGCASCDTNYRVRERATVDDIASRVRAEIKPVTRWAWVTGGEPTDHDLGPLLASLRETGLKVAVATAGVKEFDRSLADFVSVSPHSLAGWVLKSGDEVKLVLGLNGLRPSEELANSCEGFQHRFVSPVINRDGVADRQSVSDCVEWVSSRGRWRMDCQSHKQWQIA